METYVGGEMSSVPNWAFREYAWEASTHFKYILHMKELISAFSKKQANDNSKVRFSIGTQIKLLFLREKSQALRKKFRHMWV